MTTTNKRPETPAQGSAPKDYWEIVRAADQKMLTEDRSLSEAILDLDDDGVMPPPFCPS